MASQRILRNLSPSELVYDYEHGVRNCHIFSNALHFRAKDDLITSNNETIRECVLDWCKLNSFLRTKISVVSPARTEIDSQPTNSRCFSLDRKFVLISPDSLDVMRNIEIFKNTNWRSFYERELNREAPLNYDTENNDKLLWRLVLIKTGENQNPNGTEFKYCMILTIHHAITDGRNAFAIMLELIKLFEESMSGIKRTISSLADDIPVSLEDLIHDKLSNRTASISTSTLTNSICFCDDICKIPLSFSPMFGSSSCSESESCGGGVSARVNETSENMSSSSSKGFVKKVELFPSVECVTRFESFAIDRVVVKKVLNIIL